MVDTYRGIYIALSFLSRLGGRDKFKLPVNGIIYRLYVLFTPPWPSQTHISDFALILGLPLDT